MTLKKAGLILLILTTTVLLALAVAPKTAAEVQASTGQIDPVQATSTPEVTRVTPLPTLTPALVGICACESGQGTGKPQQFDIRTGGVLHGRVNDKDIGMCQINEYWNGADAKRLGFDLYTEAGNIGYANHMYSTQGSAPWNSSRGCWAK